MEERELTALALSAAAAAGSDYADVRFVREESESIAVRDTRVEGIDTGVTRGIGVRVVLGGCWGFAGTATLNPAEIERTARLAVEIARASSMVRGAPAHLAPQEPIVATCTTPFAEDPFAIPLQKKVSHLLEATDAMRSVPGLAIAEASMQYWRRHSLFLSSEGADIEQTILQSGAGIVATAVGEGDFQQRSYPNSPRGNYVCGGFEFVREMDLAGNGARVARESLDLLAAPECPSLETTLILFSNQLGLQIHESVGHPTELDRILGMEAAYAGTSFVNLEDRGRLRYGSPLVSITADATLAGALGSFGFDDEGVPAQRTPLIVDGVLENFLTSRETASLIGGKSNGTARAENWGAIPLIRMTNINLEPGQGSLADLIADTQEGIYLDTNRSWSIDDKRMNFQFGCEIAHEIHDGKLGRLYKNPNYSGRTTEFWGSCDAIAGPEEWKVWGTPNCGKGQPGQVARVAHGASPARFRGVAVGVKA